MNFELSLDHSGRPIIKFRWHKNHNDLESKVLTVFCEAALKNGLELKTPTGLPCSLEGINYEDCEIQIKRNE